MDKTIQGKLVIITFLIAVFLLGQYIWEKIPRYKIKESVGTYHCYESSNKLRCGIVQKPKTNNEVVAIGVDYREVDYYFCLEGEGGHIRTCYIKEKVRIK